jgi:hypothetical protein
VGGRVSKEYRKSSQLGDDQATRGMTDSTRQELQEPDQRSVVGGGLGFALDWCEAFSRLDEGGGKKVKKWGGGREEVEVMSREGEMEEVKK